MHMLRVAVPVAGLVCIVSPHAQTQGLDTLTAAQRAGRALARLRGGQRVQIVTRDSGLVEGSVEATSPTVVGLRTQGTVRYVTASSVDSLWVRGSHAGVGALIGGAVVGIGFGFMAQSFSSYAGACNGPYSGQPCRTSPFSEGFVLGGLGGALIGALIGGASPKWQLRVP